MSILTDERPVALPACPDWCALTHDEPAAPDTDGRRYVHHAGPVLAEAGGRSVDLTQTTVVEPDGTAEHDEPAVMLDGDPLRALGVAEAWHLAAALALAGELATGGVQ